MTNLVSDHFQNQLAKGGETEPKEPLSTEIADILQTGTRSHVDETSWQSLDISSTSRYDRLDLKPPSRSALRDKHGSSSKLSPRSSSQDKHRSSSDSKKLNKHSSERLSNNEASHPDRYHDSRRKSNRKTKSESVLSPKQRKSLEDSSVPTSRDRHHHYGSRSNRSSRPLYENNGTSERTFSRSPHRRSSRRHRSSTHKSDPESPSKDRRRDSRGSRHSDSPESPNSSGSPHQRRDGDSEDPYLASIGKVPLSRGKGSRKLDVLYGTEDEDAKAKEKARKGRSERVVSPGVEHVASSKSTAIDILYGDGRDDDAKAKAKASRGAAPAATTHPGVDRISSSSRGSTNNKSRRSNRTLATLYGDDSDAKMKAKASRGSSSELASSPGVESIAFHSTTNSTISTLYGSEADSKSKSRTSKGSSVVAGVPGVESVRYDSSRGGSMVDTLYGSDADMKAKTRASVGSTVATNLRAANLGNNDVEGSVSQRLSTTSRTGSMSSLHTNPQRKATNVSSDGIAGFAMPNDPNAAYDPNAPYEFVPENKTGKKKKKRLILFVILLFLIGGGVGVWYFLFRSSDGSNNDNTGTISLDIQEPSSAPALLGVSTLMPVLSAEASGVPSALPSTQPTTEFLLYERPSKSNCDAIAKNQTIAGREEMENADFGLDLEVVLAENISMTKALLEELLIAIQEKILPSLAGCSVVVDRFTEAWRFVIFDAFVNGYVQPKESCLDEAVSAQNCHRIFVDLSLFLKGNVRFLDIIRLISDERENFSSNLGLSNSTFLVVKMIGAEALTRTSSPTMMPSYIPSSSPTVQSIAGPTLVATNAPTLVPTSELAISNPTLVPSKAPTLVPTSELTQTETFEPSPVPSTARPSQNLSLTPSARPSVALSNSPTLIPTNQPSGNPTDGPASPSESPSSSPSRNPSASPIVAPSLDPSPKPSSSPSATLSEIVPTPKPTFATYLWVVCGSNGGCLESDSVQNANYNRLEGLPMGREIAVRCCSDTALPGFIQKNCLCPFAVSKIAGVCHNSVNFFEALNLCLSVGARLCTNVELLGECTSDLGCGHDTRFIWSNTPV